MVGKTMKSSSGWFVEGNGDNQSGFGALPAGERQSYQISNYFGLGYFAYFWTSTPTYWWEAKDTTKNHYTAVARSLDAKKVDIGRDNWPPRWEGFSVRCMKDDAVPPPVSISRPVNQKPKLSAVKPIQPSKPTEIILKAKVVDSIPNSDPALKQGFSNFHIEPGLLILGKVNSPELVALNPDSHDTLWKWVANENLQPARVLENMGIILVQSKTHLNGIRKSDGQLLWTRQGSFGIQFSVMKDSVMYIPKLDSLLAVNCVNGNLLWGIAGGERTYYHPDLLGDLLIYPLANTQYTRNPEIVPKKVTMTAIDRFTGKSLWQYQSLGNPWSCKVIDSLALISPLSTEMGSYCIAVNSGTGEEVWRTYLMHTSSPGRFLDWNNSAFCIGGGYSSDFYAFRIGSDGNLLWKTIIPRPINHGNETPVLNQGKAWFIFMRDDKRGGLAGIDPETGRTLYVLDLPSKPVTYPVFLDGKIYISLMTGFFIIQAPTL
jgi:outer membrane protein assembly factor BamB